MLARLRARGDARMRAGGCGRRAPHAPGEARRGDVAPAGLLRFAAVAASRAAMRALPASFRAAGSLAGPVLLAACVGGSVRAPRGLSCVNGGLTI